MREFFILHKVNGSQLGSARQKTFIPQPSLISILHVEVKKLSNFVKINRKTAENCRIKEPRKVYPLTHMELTKI